MTAGDVVPTDVRSRASTVAVEHHYIGCDLNGLVERLSDSISMSAEL